MWSHCKFISTGGPGHDSVNHRFESKLTQFGWETTKKGVCDEALISRDFKLFLEVDLSRVLSLFQTHPQSTLKPQPSRSVLFWKKGGGVRAVCKWCHMISQWQRDKGEGVKGEVTRSALAVPVLCSISISVYPPSSHHLLVNVLPPPQLVWDISKSQSCHPHSSDVPFNSETSSIAENIMRVNI